MAAKGTTAKSYIENKLIEVFGADKCFVADKKIYIMADDGGEEVQIALTMTCPKVFVEPPTGVSRPKTAAPAIDRDFFDWTLPSEEPPKPVTEISQEEKDRVQALLEKLGL